MSKTLQIIKELHKKTLGSYIKKASAHVAGTGMADSKTLKHVKGIGKASDRLSRTTENATAQDHHDAYHHAMGAHFDHYNNGRMDDGDKAAHAAEWHAEQYHKLTGKKLHDPGYMADSPHITSDSKNEEVLDEGDYKPHNFHVGDLVQHKHGGDPTGGDKPGVVHRVTGSVVHVKWPEFKGKIAREHGDDLYPHGQKNPVVKESNETLPNYHYIVGHVKPEHEAKYSGHKQVIVGGPYSGHHEAKEDRASFDDHPHYKYATVHAGHELKNVPHWHEVETPNGSFRSGLKNEEALDEAMDYGTRVRIHYPEWQRGGLAKHFHGKTGTIIGTEKMKGEPAHHRVRLDHPAHIEGVGEVKDDLWQRSFLKKHKEKTFKDAAATGNPRHFANEEVLDESVTSWKNAVQSAHGDDVVFQRRTVIGAKHHHTVAIKHGKMIGNYIHKGLGKGGSIKEPKTGKWGMFEEVLDENTLNTDTKINTRDPRKNEYFDDMSHYVRVEVRHPWKPGVVKHHVWSGYGPSPHKPGDTVHQYDDGNGTTRFGRPRYDHRAGRVIQHSGGTNGTVTHVANSADEMKAWPKERLRLYVKK